MPNARKDLEICIEWVKPTQQRQYECSVKVSRYYAASRTPKDGILRIQSRQSEQRMMTGKIPSIVLSKRYKSNVPARIFHYTTSLPSKSIHKLSLPKRQFQTSIMHINYAFIATFLAAHSIVAHGAATLKRQTNFNK